MNYDSKKIRTWSMIGMTGMFGIAMNELANKVDNLNVVTADLCSFSGLDRFKQEYPEKLYNVGIAEQNMVGVAAGMVSEGQVVFAGTYATFASTRALDQVRISMGYMQLPVKLVGLTAGFASGILGATHMALEDIAIMRAIPNITILSPADCTEAMKCMEAVVEYNQPVYIRLTGDSRMPIIYKEDYKFEIGKNILLKHGNGVGIFATGSMVAIAMQVAQMLESYNIEATVVDVHTLKPFDYDSLSNFINYDLVVSIEEHSTIGGLGSILSEYFVEKDRSPRLLRLGTKDDYLHAASYKYLLEKSGLTKEVITKKILEAYSN